jgi:predicted nuclease of predicted toxin-antitoxin system
MQLNNFSFLTDENVHPQIIDYLRKSGLNVKDVREQKWNGYSDLRLLTLAFKEKRVIVTHDNDFGKIIFSQPLDFLGILYLRPGHFFADFHISILKSLFQIYPEVQIPFKLVAEKVADTIKIRIRNFSGF